MQSAVKARLSLRVNRTASENFYSSNQVFFKEIKGLPKTRKNSYFSTDFSVITEKGLLRYLHGLDEAMRNCPNIHQTLNNPQNRNCPNLANLQWSSLFLMSYISPNLKWSLKKGLHHFWQPNFLRILGNICLVSTFVKSFSQFWSELLYFCCPICK